MFGPPGRSRGALLFYLGNLFLWGYPVYFFYVSRLLKGMKEGHCFILIFLCVGRIVTEPQ